MGKSTLRRQRPKPRLGSQITPAIRRRLAVILLLIAAILVTLPSKLRSAEAAGPIQIDQQLLTDQVVKNPPVRIIIPKLNLDLPVVVAPVVGGYWQLSDTSASYGVGSAHPGEVGNMVIFAHAREGLFLPLREVKKEELVYILSADKWYRYKVSDIKFVDPSQVEVIKPTSNEQVTLFTCSGFLDSKRLVVTALPDH